MAWEPLPTGEGANPLIRRLKAIDAEIYGHIYAQSGTIGGDVTIEGSLTGNDIFSTSWDGGADLSSGPDTTALNGFFFDSSAGAAQFMEGVYVGGEIVLESNWGAAGSYTINLDPNNYATNPTIELSANYNALYPAQIWANVSGTLNVRAGFSVSRPVLELHGETSGDGAGDAILSAAGSGQVVLNGGDVLVADQILTSTVATHTAPPYSFNGNTGTGMYRVGTNIIGWSAAATSVMQLTSTYLRMGPTGTYTPILYVGTKSTNPSFTFSGDATTGMGRGTAGQVVLYSAGTAELYLSGTQLVVPNVYNDSLTASANVYVATNGRLQRATSALKYKKKVRDGSWLSGIKLRPVSFKSKKNNSTHYGFIADEIASELPKAGEYGEDGEIENYDTRAVLAVLAAKVNQLEAEVRELKGGNN